MLLFYQTNHTGKPLNRPTLGRPNRTGVYAHDDFAWTHPQRAQKFIDTMTRGIIYRQRESTVAILGLDSESLEHREVSLDIVPRRVSFHALVEQEPSFALLKPLERSCLALRHIPSQPLSAPFLSSMIISSIPG